MHSWRVSAIFAALTLVASNASALEPPAPTPEANVDLRSDGKPAILYATRSNVSDLPVRGEPEYAICTLPCSARLSTERSYLTLGADGAASRPFRIGPLTTALVVNQGSGTTRSVGLFASGLGAVALGAGLGLGTIYAIANDDNNPATAETAGSLALPLIVSGAVTLALGLVLYAVSGTSVRDQVGHALALRLPPRTAFSASSE